jgi:hypothetical protein
VFTGADNSLSIEQPAPIVATRCRPTRLFRLSAGVILSPQGFLLRQQLSDEPAKL